MHFGCGLLRQFFDDYVWFGISEAQSQLNATGGFLGAKKDT